MKKGILLAVFAAIVSILVYSYPTGAALNGYDCTNASGPGGCGQGCHTSATTNGTKVELDSAGVAVTSYHPGTAYMVKISATNTTTTSLPKFGFQLTVVKLVGAGTTPVDAGTWGTALPASVQNTPPGSSGLNETIIEQLRAITATSGTGGSGTTYVEIIPWTAPVAGTGSVVIYGVINAVNNNGNNGGDKYQDATQVTITEAVATAPVASVSISQTAGASTVCAGASVTFTATATNGGTAPTYQWKVNGTAVTGATSATFTTTTLAAGSDAITCVMISNLSGVTGNPATSNSITETVNTSVTPSVSIVSTTTTICSGQSVAFTATPTNGGTSPAYQWYNGTTAISGATASTYSSTTLTGTASITVKLTSNASCPSTPTVTSNAIGVTVSGSVTPAISITSSAGNSLCSSQSTTFTATPVNGGSSPAYQWYKNGSAIGGATASTYSASGFANNDAITCQLTSSSGCASPATATSSAITITITSNGTPSLTIASNVGNSICSGQTIIFTASPTNGGTAPTYQWYNGATIISGATSSVYSTNSIITNTTISCKMVSNSQCVTTNNATSNTLTITVSGSVTPAVSITSNVGTSVCSGQTATFTEAAVNGGPSPVYQWYNSGSAISGATSSTYSSSTLANGASITVVLTSSSACASPTTATSNAITMNVGNSSTASVIATSNAGTSICNSQNATLTATPDNGGAAPAYQWMLNGSNIPGATSSTYTPPSIANGNAYTVQMVSSSSCVTQSTVVSGALTFSVVAGGPATVAVTPNVGTTICQGVSVTFTAIAVNGGSNPTYQWTKNGNNVGNATTTYIDNTLSNGDVINCSVSSSLTCASPATAVSNYITMTVHSQPVAIITNNNNVLTSSLGSAYQWYLNNVSVSNGNSQIFTPQANGNYTVEVTNVYGCEALSAPYDVTTVGISEPSALESLSVYPNPAENNLFVDFKGTAVEGKVIIRLLDMNGRILIENMVTPVSGEKISLDLGWIRRGEAKL